MDNIQIFREHMAQFTTCLVRSIDIPEGDIAARTGFIVERGGRYLVVTAQHKMKVNDHWFVETSSLKPDRRPLCIPVKSWQFLCTGDISSPHPVKQVDIAWGLLDLQSVKRQLEEEKPVLSQPLALSLYLGPIGEPEMGEAYGFATYGNVKFDPYRSERTLVRSLVCELGLELKRWNSERGEYEFTMVGEHQGDEYYMNSSGAPIADPEGKIVSILVGASETRDVLYGVPLSKYEPLWDLPF